MRRPIIVPRFQLVISWSRFRHAGKPRVSSSSTDLNRVKEGLVAAGVEIYRTQPEEIQVAERVRLHIMDSGIRVRIEDALGVVFTARSQQSDFPNIEADQLFEKVRTTVGEHATGRGYTELASQTVEVKDPMDDSKILDTWHEITYSKAMDDLEGLISEVQWALSVDKYVSP
ncbi:MAG: hypothetical protein AB8I08_04765 [Sandaracinaceae bacterium]